MTGYLKKLIIDYPALAHLEHDVQEASELLVECYHSGGTIYTCGNGGSAADAEHIVGELMKGFHLKRNLNPDQIQEIARLYPDEATEIEQNLQEAIPAVSLVSSMALSTAFANDVNPDYVFAQQIYGLGRAGDILIAISTSGNSGNVVLAAKLAKVKDVRVIGLAGETGGKLQAHCDLTIKAPSADTAGIQEFHLPIYHCLCSMLEEAVFS